MTTGCVVSKVLAITGSADPEGMFEPPLRITHRNGIFPIRIVDDIRTFDPIITNSFTDTTEYFTSNVNPFRGARLEEMEHRETPGSSNIAYCGRGEPIHGKDHGSSGWKPIETRVHKDVSVVV